MWIQASAPPQIATSTSPARIMRAASPIACTPAAQAVTGAPNGPLNPYLIETCPAAKFTRNEGMVKGDNLRVPRASAVRTASAIAGKPPTPEAIIVAVRSCCSVVVGCHCACCRASSVAASASKIKRSILRWSLGLTMASGFKPASASSSIVGTTPPTLAGKSLTISSGRRRKPDLPASNRCHTGSIPQPSGEAMPIPVITMRVGWLMVIPQFNLHDDRHL